MSQVQQFLNDLILHSDTVRKQTLPLHRLGVISFYYFTTNAIGDHLLLTDSPEVDEYYYSKKYYLKDFYLRHPSNYQSGLSFFNAHNNQEQNEWLVDIANRFTMSHLIGLCEKHEKSVDFFGFWFNSEPGSKMNSEHIYFTDLLRLFAEHFKTEYRSIIQANVTPRLFLPHLLGDDLFNSTVAPYPFVDKSTRKAFLREIGHKQQVSQADSLSPRERECIQLLLHGKSMKESATLLQLSPRTVEHYIERIKTKLGCRYKNQLFSKAEQLHRLGLI